MEILKCVTLQRYFSNGLHWTHLSLHIGGQSDNWFWKNCESLTDDDYYGQLGLTNTKFMFLIFSMG